MAVNSKRKGAHGEREAVKYLKSLGFAASRTQQFCGVDGDGDVTCEDLPGIHFEVKFGYKGGLDLGSKLLKDAMSQAETDASNGTIPVVLWKPYRARIWRLTFNSGMLGELTTTDRIRDVLLLFNRKAEGPNGKAKETTGTGQGS